MARLIALADAMLPARCHETRLVLARSFVGPVGRFPPARASQTGIRRPTVILAAQDGAHHSGREFVMTTQDIANDLVALCKAGKFAESGEKYWAADVVSVEAGNPGGDPVSRGIDAARGKGEWWANNHDVHGDQFVVH